MQDEDVKKNLYDALVGEYDLGTYEEFVKGIGNPNTRRNLYDAIKDEYDVGTYENFSQQLFPANWGTSIPGADKVEPTIPFKAKEARDKKFNPSESTEVSWDVPMFKQDAQQASPQTDPMETIQSAMDTAKTVGALGDRIAEQSKQPFNQPKSRATDLDAFKTEEQKAQENYINRAAQQANYDLQVNHQIDAEIAQVTKEIEEEQARFVNSKMYNAALLTQGVSEHSLPGFGQRGDIFEMSPRIQELRTRLATLKKAKEYRTIADEINKNNDYEGKSYRWANVGLGVKQYFSDFITDHMNPSENGMGRAIAKLGISEKISRGENLTDDERAMWTAFALEDLMKQRHGEAQGDYGYIAGYGTPQMVQFMIELAMSPGSAWSGKAASATEAAAKSAMQRMIRKYGATVVRKNLMRVSGYMAKQGARLGGVAANSLATAYTMQAPAFVEGTADKMAGIAIGSHDNEGNLRGTGVVKRTSAGRAVYEQSADMWVENFSEGMFEGLGAGQGIRYLASKAAGKAATSKLGGKILGSATAKTVSEMIDRTTSAQWYKAMGKVLEAGQIGSWPEEMLEEYAAIPMRHWLGIADPESGGIMEELTSRETLYSTLAGLSLGMGCMSAVQVAPAAIGVGVDAVRRRSAHKAYLTANTKGAALFGGDWENLRSQVDALSEDDMGKGLEAIINSVDTPEKKSAILSYMIGLQRERGYNRMEAKKREEGAIDSHEEAYEDSHAEGYDMENPTEIQSTVKRLKELSNLYGADLDAEIAKFDSPVDFLRAIEGKATEEEMSIAQEYINLSARRDGILERMEDDTDARVEVMRDKIDARTHRQSGAIVTTQLRDKEGNVIISEDGSPVTFYVIDGDVDTTPYDYTFEDEDGITYGVTQVNGIKQVIPVRQAQGTVVIRDSEGNLQMVPGTSLSDFSVFDSSEMKADEEARIREDAATQEETLLNPEAVAQEEVVPAEVAPTPEASLTTEYYANLLTQTEQGRQAKEMIDQWVANEEDAEFVVQRVAANYPGLEETAIAYYNSLVAPSVVSATEIAPNDAIAEVSADAAIPVPSVAVYDKNGDLDTDVMMEGGITPEQMAEVFGQTYQDEALAVAQEFLQDVQAKREKSSNIAAKNGSLKKKEAYWGSVVEVLTPVESSAVPTESSTISAVPVEPVGFPVDSRAEAAKARWDAAPKVYGRQSTVRVKGKRLKGRYVIVPAGTATASHTADFQDNPDFIHDEKGANMNPRDYSQSSNQSTTLEIAGNYELQSVQVVSPDGIVYDGNGRQIAGDIAARQSTDGAYAEDLAARAEEFGFTQEQVQGMPHARVYFEVEPGQLDYSAGTFDMFNAPEMKAASLIEKGLAMGKVLTEATFNLIADVIKEAGGMKAVYKSAPMQEALIRILQNAEDIKDVTTATLPQYYNEATRSLTEAGKELVEAAILGKIFSNAPEILSILPNLPAKVRSRIAQAMPELAANQKLGEYALSDEIAKALTFLYEAYQAGESLDVYGEQYEFFKDGTNADVIGQTVKLLAKSLNGELDEAEFADIIRSYNLQAVDVVTGQDQLFGEAPTREDILQNVIDAYMQQGLREESVSSALSGQIGRSLSESEVRDVLAIMEVHAEESPKIELTRENWDNLFSNDKGIVTPIGGVKMGENQFTKMNRPDRRGKFGMIRPTLESPDVIIEDFRPSSDGNSERETSYIFVKTFLRPEDGGKKKPYYYFTSVTVLKGGREVVISNQERGKNRLSKLLQTEKVTWINPRNSPHPKTRIEESVLHNDSRVPTSSDNQDTELGINSPVSGSKDSTLSPNPQAKNEKKNEGEFGLVSDARMEELKTRIRNKLRGQMNSGIDPELLALCAEMTIGYIDRGLHTFKQVARQAFEDFGDAVRPYIKGSYNNARDILEEQEPTLAARMTPYEEVRQTDLNNLSGEDSKSEEKSISSQSREDASDTEKQAQRSFVNAIKTDMLAALETGVKPYRSIKDLRKRAQYAGMRVDWRGSMDVLLQELAEAAMVEAARDVLYRANQKGASAVEIYNEIVRLYNLQPSLNQRSSSKIVLGQYSTPLPMAFLADLFVYREGMGHILEPTAGNGLLAFALPSAIVHANEIDATRVGNLREQGYSQVSEQDATQPFAGRYDAVVANPPFASTPAKNYDGYNISGLAQQIAINALESMADNGRAAIIVDGNMDYEANGSIKGKRAFFAYLYDHYNVQGVIDMDGSLYQRQGTTYPTRMILISGRRSETERAKSTVYPPVREKALPKATTYEELFNLVNQLNESNETTNGTEVLRSGGMPVVPVSDDTRGGTDRGGRGSESNQGNQPVERVRGGLDSGPESVLVERERDDRADGRGNTGGRGRDMADSPRPGGLLAGREQSEGDTEHSGMEGEAGTLVRGEAGVPGGRQAHVDAQDNTPGVSAKRSRVLLENRSLESEKLPYRPHNSAFSLESVAPAAMVEAMDKMLQEIEKEHGDIEEFVRNELHYDSVEALHNALAAEQLDSVAMAIYQMQRGQALIIGDQTGVGKGRQMAALIRWAVFQGKKPIFITQNANLFSDIYRDLLDIGSGELRPFIFNAPRGDNPGVMEDTQGNIVYKALSAAKQKRVLESGVLPEEYDYVVLTYSQVSTGDETSQEEAKEKAKKSRGRAKTSAAVESGKTTPKATFLRQIAEDNYLFLDESHTAAGESNTGAYMQSIVKVAKAVTFASATFAKRPDTMPLYALRTAMNQAKVVADDLIEVIKKGGVTLQELMSRALTAAGQMVRRERDMTDVVTDWKFPTSEEVIRHAREEYDKAITAFNAIIRFQEEYVAPTLEGMSKDMASMMSSVGGRRGTKKLGIDNPPFTNKIFNYTKQLMLALKVEAIVEEVIKEIKAGRHPVIALESTMENAVGDYKAGDVVTDPTFGASLLKGLDSVMKYTLKDPQGASANLELVPDQLGPSGKRAYYELRKLIYESTKGIYISPLDAITSKLQEQGYKVGELTGRKVYLTQNEDGKQVVMERKDRDKKRIMREFNSGELDVLILNKSASTGISLHASEKFSDQRQRTMIIAQPLSDINDYMQMIGRIDRTGQVHRGYYINLGLPVPAETRFLMMLSTKLKSLNANTTTSQDNQSNNVEAPDLLNKYGDQVVVEYLRDNPDIYVKLGEPLKKGGNTGGTVEVGDLEKYTPKDDDARRVTGRVALLSVAEQEDFYNGVVERYNALINYLNDTDSNDLKITVLPLEAKTVDKKVSSEGADAEGNNPFAGSAYVEKVEMNVLRKPMTSSDIKKTIEQVNKGMEPTERLAQITKTILAESEERYNAEEERAAKERAKNDEMVAKYSERVSSQKKLSEEEKEQAIEEYAQNLYSEQEKKTQDRRRVIESNLKSMMDKLGMFTVGESYLVPDMPESMVYSSTSPAIFCGYKTKDSKITPSTTFAVFATLDGRRRVEIKLSQPVSLVNITNATRTNYDIAKSTSLSNWDSQIPTNTRKEGYIMTGNILQAIADTRMEGGAFPGQLISYTDIEGNIHDGILMPDGWKPTSLRTNGVPISARANQIKAGADITSADGQVRVVSRGNSITLFVPRSQKAGGKFFKNATLLGLAQGRNFFSYGGKMCADINMDYVDELLTELSNLGVRVSDEAVEDNKRYRSADKHINAEHDARRSEAVMDRARALAEQLGLPLRVVSAEEARTLSGEDVKAKGWFDTETGEIVIVAPNNTSDADAVETLLHEGVAHFGLRQLFGDNFDKFLDEVYKGVSNGVRAKIDALASDKGLSTRVATEEYLAELAESTDFEKEADKSLWNKVKSAFKAMLRAVGVTGFGTEISDNELRYILWRSYENLRNNGNANIYTDAKDIVLQKRLEVGRYHSDNRRYRSGRPNPNNPAEVLRSVYDSMMASARFLAKEASIDYLLAVSELQNLISNVTGKVITDAQDVYSRMLTLTSRNKEQIDFFDYAVMPVLTKAINAIVGKGKIDWERGIARTLATYAMIKHGIERNRDMAVREAIAEKARAEFIAQFSPELSNLSGQISNLTTKIEEYRTKIVDAISQGADPTPFTQAKDALTAQRQDLERQKRELFNAPEKHGYKPLDAILSDMWENWYTAIQDIRDDANLSWREQQAAMDDEARKQFGLTLDKEYSGLEASLQSEGVNTSGMNAQEVRQQAYDFVEQFEAQTGEDRIDALWEAIRFVNSWTLEKQLSSQLINRSYLEDSKRRYEFYVPLRGFDETTAQDEYDYLDEVRGDSSNPVIAAQGRRSMAANPFANIMNVGYRSITAGNRNEALQAYWDLATRADVSEFLVPSKSWRIGDVTSTEATYIRGRLAGIAQVVGVKGEQLVPDIPDNATTEQVSQIMRDFEEAMKELKRNGYVTQKSNVARDFPYRIINSSQLKSHTTKIYVNGEARTVTITANPRVAQALSGKLNPDSRTLGIVRRVQSFMQGALTSVNLLFSIANLVRDTLHANRRAFIMENPKYFLKFTAKQKFMIGNAYNWGKMLRLLMRYENSQGRTGRYYSAKMGIWGELDESNPVERRFKRFMELGGATGFTFSRSQRENLQYLAEMANNPQGKKLPNAFSPAGFFDVVSALSEASELVNRYAAYETSLEMGRSEISAIRDAKEITLNFNRKGAGFKTYNADRGKGGKVAERAKYSLVNGLAAMSQFGRDNVIFWNASIQGVYQVREMFKKSPVKTLTSVIAVPMGVALASIPLLNNILLPALYKVLSTGDGDDEEYTDYYDELPDWERQRNICIRLPKGHGWVKIPLDVSSQAAWAIGDAMGAQIAGKREFDAWNDGFANAISLASPVEINWGDDTQGVLTRAAGASMSFTPSVLKPVVDLYTNKDWKGKPITKDTPYNKYLPEYKRVYSSTSPTFIGLSKALHNLGNTDGAETYGRNHFLELNPAQIQYVLESLSGGYAKTVIASVDGALSLLSEEVKKEYRTSDNPLVSRFYVSGGHDYSVQRLQSLYYNEVGTFLKEMSQRQAQLKRDLEDARNAEDDMKIAVADTAITHFKESKEYELWQDLKSIDSHIKKEEGINGMDNLSSYIIDSMKEAINKARGKIKSDFSDK